MSARCLSISKPIQRTYVYIANIVATRTMSDFRAATDAMAFDNDYVFSYGSVLLYLDEMAD
jgi:hypothetical protein